jgi:peptidoglycan hydrolase FlgJ
MNAIGPTTPSAPTTTTDPVTADKAEAAAPEASSVATPRTTSPEETKRLAQAKEAAQKFEAIFLRQMLSGLEKTNKIGGSSSSKGGGGGSGGAGGIYGSMMVNSLADTISQSGGVGLADVILRALQGPHTNGAPKK